MLTESTEMYLITVYRLTTDATYASASDIASRLGVNISSVSEKVKRLTEQGYLAHEPREGIQLTTEGQRVALNVLRKHRLIKSFLVNMAGYPIDEVYDEACRLEHAISDRLADSLEKLLEYPDVDPHGYPIPTRDGYVHNVTYESLNNVKVGDTVVIRRVEPLNQEKLAYLRELGLVPGARAEVLDIAPFEGPISLRLSGKIIAIAPSLAQEVEISVEQPAS